MENGTWKNAGASGVFSMFHLPFALQDAFFSILLTKTRSGVPIHNNDLGKTGFHPAE
jgi:hypothetical protein